MVSSEDQMQAQYHHHHQQLQRAREERMSNGPRPFGTPEYVLYGLPIIGLLFLWANFDYHDNRDASVACKACLLILWQVVVVILILFIAETFF
ncbi:hypothetical protein P9112_001800 [Eukaryota sp. TZLM1-RC]